jgi:hypothetical protein
MLREVDMDEEPSAWWSQVEDIHIGEVENGLLCENVSGAGEAVSGQWKSDYIKR